MHKSALAAPAEKAFVGDSLDIGQVDLLDGTLTLKSQDLAATYAEGVDYSVNLETGVVTRIEGGSIASGATVSVSAYEYADPSKVAADDIVGGVDGATGKPEGLELVNSVFPMFRILPGTIVAPGWSDDPAVAAVMA